MMGGSVDRQGRMQFQRDDERRKVDAKKKEKKIEAPYMYNSTYS